MRNTKTMMKTGVAALLLLLQLFVLAAPAAARYIANPDPDDDQGGAGGFDADWVYPAGGFAWEAPDRANKWWHAWRERGANKVWPIETYNGAYVNPSSWTITVMGCHSENDFLSNAFPEVYAKLQQQDEEDETDYYPDQTTLYRWQWNGENTGFTKDCFGNLDFPAEGIYYPTLTVRTADGVETSFTKPVEVKDFLVVVLGDSSASGEGAPDKPIVDGSNANADWIDDRCHRSNNAGSAQAARRIEAGDSHTSVTFLSFACSGATLAKTSTDTSMPDPYENGGVSRGSGITGTFAGIEPLKNSEGEPDYTKHLPSQISQLWNALTDFGAHKPRRIDVLIVAGGINDARFADMAATCVLFPFCYGKYVGLLGSQITMDDQFLKHDVKTVPLGWDLLNEKLNTPYLLDDGTYASIGIDKKLALQYPPFFHDDEGDQCLAILGDSTPGWVDLLGLIFVPLFPLFPPGWTVDEISHADEFWAPALDDNVRLGAGRNGFEYVDTIANRFYLHGVCADDRWINNPTDSLLSQGDEDGRIGHTGAMSSKGTAHPNTKGYSAYADEILRHLNTLTKRDGNTPPVAAWDKVTVSYGKARKFNVLANDSDEDSVDVLGARIASEPAHGKVTMQIDGTATYTPSSGFVGSDFFAYEVTDGQATTVGAVFITVLKPTRYLPRVIAGETAEIGGLLVGLNLEPPYRLEFDKPPQAEFGNFYFEPDDGILYFDPPPLRRRRIRLDYTLYSDTPNLTSPSYGESTRGILVLRVKRPR